MSLINQLISQIWKRMAIEVGRLKHADPTQKTAKNRILT